MGELGARLHPVLRNQCVLKIGLLALFARFGFLFGARSLTRHHACCGHF